MATARKFTPNGNTCRGAHTHRKRQHNKIVSLPTNLHKYRYNKVNTANNKKNLWFAKKNSTEFSVYSHCSRMVFSIIMLRFWFVGSFWYRHRRPSIYSKILEHNNSRLFYNKNDFISNIFKEIVFYLFLYFVENFGRVFDKIEKTN